MADSVDPAALKEKGRRVTGDGLFFGALLPEALRTQADQAVREVSQMPASAFVNVTDDEIVAGLMTSTVPEAPDVLWDTLSRSEAEDIVTANILTTTGSVQQRATRIRLHVKYLGHPACFTHKPSTAYMIAVPGAIDTQSGELLRDVVGPALTAEQVAAAASDWKEKVGFCLAYARADIEQQGRELEPRLREAVATRRAKHERDVALSASISDIPLKRTETAVELPVRRKRVRLQEAKTAAPAPERVRASPWRCNIRGRPEDDRQFRSGYGAITQDCSHAR